MLNRLENALKSLNSNLFGKLQETEEEVKLLLQKYSNNFPQYTDHSLEHTRQVFDYASDLLSDEQISNLNEDEIYILSMACYLHDIGMCIPESKIESIKNTEEIIEFRNNNPKKPVEDYIRDIHHVLSYKFIVHESELLKIPNEKYAEAIGLVAQGHRKVDLGNVDVYKPKFSVKSGKTFVCLPYLAAVIRLADELDITNIRTPRLLTKYYMPDNDISIKEWNKHISTTIVNLYDNDDSIRFEVVCTDQNVYAALQEQFQKLEETLFYSQKIIKNISNTGLRKFELNYSKLLVDYKFKGFDPKGIKFSFNVNNVVNTFIGEDLYENKLAALREAIQNAIDTCRYKRVLCGKSYKPNVTIELNKEFISISDNGLGMDEFIVENYFGKLASSYYQEDNVKKDYEAIGQFGVGVFSYFLISEYIDIETKTDKEQALKFRIDKDPNNYFHFFEKTERKNSGTTIKLYLKPDFQIDIKSIRDYIYDTFRYIEFSIYIKYGEDELEIVKQDFKVEIDGLLKNSLKYQYSDKLDQVLYYNYDFNSESCEGSLSLIYDIDKSFQDFDVMFDNSLYNNGRHYRNLFNISQKGVFVSSLTDYGYLLYCIGNINLKSKIKINLSRHGFSQNDVIKNIINDIGVNLIKSFFNDEILNLDIQRLPDVTYSFFIAQNSFKFLHTLIYVRVFNNAEEKIMTVSELIGLNYKKMKVLDRSKTEYVPEDIIIQRPLSKVKLHNRHEYLIFFEQIFAEKYTSEYHKLDGEIFMFLDKKDENNSNENNALRKLLNHDYYFKNIYDRKCLGLEIGTFISYINANHEFIELLNLKLNQINESVNSIKIKKIIDEILVLIRRRIDGFGNEDDDIESINKLIKSLKLEIEIDYEFTSKDFKTD